MSKTPTKWTPDDSGSADSDNAGFFLLLETGDRLLLETGDKLLLEDEVQSAKTPTLWSES